MMGVVCYGLLYVVVACLDFNTELFLCHASKPGGAGGDDSQDSHPGAEGGWVADYL
jgi:hypothetical protein